MEAEIYDDTVEFTQPFYGQFHDVIIDLLKYHFESWDQDRAKLVNCVILDVGCGTGIEGIRILETFSSIHLVALDFCQPMLEMFERKLVARYGSDEWRRKCTMALIDILDEELKPSNVLSFLPRDSADLQAIVTAFALHHYTAEEKLRAYRLFYDLLPPSGLFVYGDLFSYESPTLTSYAQLHEERWILDSFSNPHEEVKLRHGVMAKSAEELRTLWIEHLRKYNIPLPIENSWTSPMLTGDEASIGSEVNLLRTAGFAEIGCPYRYFQAGVIWARK
jgi:SAM-dependent methyltransferase